MLQSRIITMMGNEISEDLARECLASCKEHNIEASLFPAVWGDSVAQVYEDCKLRPFYNLKDSRDTKGVRGCFLSHYLLWKEVMESGQPMLIFEHDALVVHDLSTNILTYSFGVLNLDSYSRTAEDYEAHFNRPPINGVRANAVEVPRLNRNFDTFEKMSIKGLHAYIIKPSGAKDLIVFTHEYGMLPADIAVNSISCDLWVTNSSLCRVNPKYWIDKKRKSKNSFTRTKDHEW